MDTIISLQHWKEITIYKEEGGHMFPSQYYHIILLLSLVPINQSEARAIKVVISYGNMPFLPAAPLNHNFTKLRLRQKVSSLDAGNDFANPSTT
jgi:hypothetical protein